MSKPYDTSPVAEAIQRQRTFSNYLQSARNNSCAASFNIDTVISTVVNSLSDIMNISAAGQINLSGICNAIKAMPSLEPAMIPSVASSLLQYAKTVERFMNQVEQPPTLDERLSQSMVPDFEPATFDYWLDSATEIVDDMANQCWLTKEQQSSVKETFAGKIKEKPSKISPAEKIMIFIAILQLLAQITGFTIFNYLNKASDDNSDAISDPPAVYKELNDSEVKIITCQTTLINDVADKLSLNTLNFSAHPPHANPEKDFKTV